MTSTTQSTQRTTITTPAVNPDPNAKSIRQIIMGGILVGKPTKEIAAEVQAAYPDSAAAKKSAKHIAWYRSDMKKRGLLPVAE